MSRSLVCRYMKKSVIASRRHRSPHFSNTPFRQGAVTCNEVISGGSSPAACCPRVDAPARDQSCAGRALRIFSRRPTDIAAPSMNWPTIISMDGTSLTTRSTPVPPCRPDLPPEAPAPVVAHPVDMGVHPVVTVALPAVTVALAAAAVWEAGSADILTTDTAFPTKGQTTSSIRLRMCRAEPSSIRITRTRDRATSSARSNSPAGEFPVVQSNAASLARHRPV